MSWERDENSGRTWELSGPPPLVVRPADYVLLQLLLVCLEIKNVEDLSRESVML
jgi:hypothetical protein